MKQKSAKERLLWAQFNALEMGSGWDDTDINKPQILIEDVYGDSHPGSVHLHELSRQAEIGVFEKGGFPAHYHATDVCDGCAQGHDGMNIVYIDKINQTIYSHAGVSQKWMNEHIPDNNLHLINTSSLTSMKFTYRDGGDWYGSSEFSSPIWIRPEGLLKCPYKDNDGIIWNQVYGHTNKIQPTKDKVGDAEFWDIDCLGRGYYMVELMSDNGKILDRTIKRFEFDD